MSGYKGNKGEISEGAVGLGVPLLLMGYCFFLTTLAVTPASLTLKAYSMLKAELGLGVSYLTLAKMAHMSAFAILALIAGSFIVRKPFVTTLALVAATLAFEAVQALIPTRSMTLEDLSMNLLGIVLGGGLVAAYSLGRVVWARRKGG